MGVFTEQVQGLVSEERIKRQEREELKKEREKKKREQLRKEEIKQQLHFILSSYFTNAKTEDYHKIYVDLLKDKNKWQVISEITKKEQEEYYLDINYTTTLNKVKSSYMIQYKEYLKEEKNKNDLIWQQKAQNILNNTTHLQPKAKKLDKTKIIFIVLLPVISLYYLFKGALYPKRKKRR